MQTHEPEAEFVRISELLSKEERLYYLAFTDIQKLARLAYKEGRSSWLYAFVNREPEAGHVTLDPCITF